jgi:tripartite-type tricarboxylate transporter receptor subunit TctC
MHEVGITDFDLTYWTGLFAPAKVPDDVVAALDRTTGEIMKAQTTQETLANLGLDLAYIARTEMTTYVRIELRKWGNYIRDAGIEPN